VGLRCLLVDVNDEFLAAAERVLGSQGLDVVGLARSGPEALRLATELAPDVALVDVELGAESGFDVTEALSAAAPSLRVILISTHAEDELFDLLSASPAVGFLAKSALGARAIADLAG
jgi:DNA-binding NarL/FixJ family response regulator